MTYTWTALLALLCLSACATTSYPPDEIGACEYSHEWLKDRVKVDASAVFEPCTNASVEVTAQDYLISSFLDTKRADGTPVRTRYTLELTHDGESWHAEDFQMEE